MRRFFLLLAVFLSLVSMPVVADTSVSIGVFATPMSGGVTGFTATYIKDGQIDLAWLNGIDTANVMIRMSYGAFPSSRTEGYLVYYGSLTSFSDTSVSTLTVDDLYYSIWAQKSDGSWIESTNWVEALFMSSSLFFLAILSLSLVLTWFSWRRPNILLGVVAFLMWLSSALYVVLSGYFDLTQTYMKIFVWVLFIMSFVPLLAQMDTEIRHEAMVKGKKVSWSDWGSEPQEKETSYERYKKQLRSRRR